MIEWIILTATLGAIVFLAIKLGDRIEERRRYKRQFGYVDARQKYLADLRRQPHFEAQSSVIPTGLIEAEPIEPRAPITGVRLDR